MSTRCSEFWTEFKGRSNPKGGRPKSLARDTLVYRLGVAYEDLTGNEPGLTVDPDTGKMTGDFPDFTTTIFEFYRIPVKGLKHAILKARRGIAAKTENR